jgi:hypothetical protein
MTFSKFSFFILGGALAALSYDGCVCSQVSLREVRVGLSACDPQEGNLQAQKPIF